MPVTSYVDDLILSAVASDVRDTRPAAGTMAAFPASYKNELERLLNELRSKSEEARRRAADDLLYSLETASKELNQTEFQHYYREVQTRISGLVVQAADPVERNGGLYALNRLIDFKGDDQAQKTTRFAGYLRAVLRSNDTSAMILAAQTLGRLAIPGGTLTAELVESEVKSALEWLQVERQENRRFAAVLILLEMARSTPTLAYQWIPQIFEVIWVALRDRAIMIRLYAGRTMGVCFNILKDRDANLRNQLLSKAYDEIRKGFQIASLEALHGSLLTLKELLQNGGMFMFGQRYKEAADAVLLYKDHREAILRHEVIEMIPALATYSPHDFAQGYLHKFMNYLQGLLRNEKTRNIAFGAIGKVASAVGNSIAPYLDAILVYIREGLGTIAKNRTADDKEVFKCISMISIAVGQTLSKYMEALLDPIFACGLSDPLIQALLDMAHYVPPVKPLIQQKLLDLLSNVLCGRPFSAIGHPGNSAALPPINIKGRRDPQQPEYTYAEIALALNTLGAFDFTDKHLNEFIRDVVIRYVGDDHPQIRRAAALTSCQLLIKDPIIHQTSQHAMQVVSEIVEKLLTVGVADIEPEIRETVLRSLDSRFDKHLGKAENIRTLFLALNDENFAVREVAMSIIGRLTTENPAYVFPSLRKVLIQLLTEMEYANSARDKQESAKLISHFVNSSSKLIRPYVDPMITVLLPKTNDPNGEVAATTLRAIGDISKVGGQDMMQYVPQLMQIIIRDLQDLSSDTRREAAMRTLGQLASNSGYVITPYTDYPELLPILMGIIQAEDGSGLRKEAIRLMGTLGALDPYKLHQVAEASPEKKTAADSQNITDVSLLMQGLTPSNEEYYPTVVINTLMGMLKDPSLKQFHSPVIDAVMNIYTTMGLKCVGFLGQVVPGFLSVIESAGANRVEPYFNQLSQLVRIVRQHIRPFLPAILAIVQNHWRDGVSQQTTILSLIESISRSLEGEFKVYLARVLPLMLDVLDHDVSRDRATSHRILRALLVFGSSAEEYMHLIIPVIVRMFEKPGQPQNVRKAAIETIGKLSRQVNISEFSARIIQPLARVLAGNDLALKQTALDTLCALIFQLGPDYVHFIPTINKILSTHKVPPETSRNYSLIVSKLQKGEPLPQDLSPDERYGSIEDDNYLTDIATKKFAVNQQHLKNAWEAAQKSTKEDWNEWFRRFSVELLRESPQQALRACTPLASIHTPIAKSLFNSAFVSCWTELYDQYQEQLVRSIEAALSAPNMPPEILQALLNLAEFMEHDDKALPIDVRTLGMYAGKCHAFAKALHYKELEFNAEHNQSAVGALISINNQLQQTDAAFGILRRAQGYQDVDMKETWFEKLQRWEEALQSYEKRAKTEPDSFEVIMGKMRCLHALGEWEDLSALAQSKWMHAATEERRRIAPLAAAAAWGTAQWDLMDNYLSLLKQNTPDRSFFGAILAIHRNQFHDATVHIEKARDGLNTELGALLGESYTRAYSVIVRVQMLAELEEIIDYKKNHDSPEKQEQMRLTWTKRLKGCQRNVEVWQRMLKVRHLVISPRQNMDMEIKFANLCRKASRLGLAQKSLQALLPSNEDIMNVSGSGDHGAPYPVSYAIFKFHWSLGHHAKAFTNMKEFAAHLSNVITVLESPHSAGASHLGNEVNGVNGTNGTYTNGINGSHLLDGHMSEQGSTKVVQQWKQLLARCYLKLGEWQTTMHRGDWQHAHVSDILASYAGATTYNQNWYKAWHAWALANFEVVTSMTGGDRETVNLQPSIVNGYVVPAVQGFFRSISLSNSSSLQDTLRLLTLWFAHGGHHEVNSAVTEGISNVNIDTWLEVIPQLIARINQPNPRVRQSIHNLLVDVGRAHPQALVYPLTVSMKSNVSRRSRAAQQLMDAMRQHSPKLVEQADLVSHELIRIAVLWHEQWHEGLEEASRLYFGDHNVDGMLETLQPLHEMLDKGPETLREISFIQSFGRDLQEARDWCDSYRRTKDIGELNQAWDLYYQVFKKVARQLPQLMSLELQYVSPRLKEAYDLELAAPGTSKPIIRIAAFDPVANVIQSKQRPRKLTLKGSDGQTYAYVLKGHEDIRQDERVMQLFGLVNTLLANDPECVKRHLNIQRYAAIPLSTQSGLLSWVPNSDTLHVLIREYRESRKILLNIEHRIMLQMAPDYDSLTLMQKVEVFGYALDNTTGQDLYRVLWLKSKSSEAWLDRRTNYTRSLAVMSMVGYILGLGDRHPSNLMLDRGTGKIIHIDFGDCFEVAMHREKYPERVPFRLTRMLTFAMEVSNIEGSYKMTCEHVMRVLRDNKESLMAVLEAFVHDPLLSWRLNNRESGPPEPNFPSERRNSIINVDSERPNDISYRPRRHSIMPNKEKDNVGNEAETREVQNARALQVLARVKEKLTGTDFNREEELNVDAQVEKLIQEATSLENLCQHYIGWCSFW